MSATGQTPRRLDPAILAVPRHLVAFASDYPAGHVIARHAHARHQLLYAVGGVMTVATDLGRWVVPPQFAVWVPAGVEHGLAMAEPVAMRSLYIAPDARPDLPRDCGVRQVTGLLKELVPRAMSLPRRYDTAGPDGRLVAVILDEIRRLPPAPFELPWPSDPRAARVAEAIQGAPEDDRSLAAWGRLVGASERTLARRFLRETGLGFRAWRRRARLLHAVGRLSAGAGVTETAFDCGYESVSAFVAAFRRELGVTPGRYAGRGEPTETGHGTAGPRRER